MSTQEDGDLEESYDHVDNSKPWYVPGKFQKPSKQKIREHVQRDFDDENTIRRIEKSINHRSG